MRNTLLVAIAIMDLLANIPYIRDALRGKTKPNLASWSSWTLINATAAIGAFAAGGALNTVILATSYLIGSLTILLIAIFKGTRKYTIFDGLCQGLSILGLVLWYYSKNPNVAIAFAIMADLFAVPPTVRHGYLHPYEETWSTFAIASVGALGILLLAESFSFAALAVPIDFFLANALIAGVIIYGRHRTKRS